MRPSGKVVHQGNRLAHLYRLRARINTEIAVLEREVQAARRAATDAGRQLRMPGEPDCGTDQGYYAHRTHGEATCQPCKDAHAAAERARKQRRIERDEGLSRKESA